MLRVYFYTSMEHENSLIVHCPSNISARPPSAASRSSRDLLSTEASITPHARRFIRHGSTEHLETLFSRLKDGPLLIAVLSYGLGLPASDVCSIRIRDVNITSQSVMVKCIAYQVPKMVLEDLREYIQDKLCGYEASVSLSKRDQRLFSEAEHRIARGEVLSWWRIFEVTRECNKCRESITGGYLASECLESAIKCSDSVAGIIDRALGLIGRVHLHRAKRRGAKFFSALELFDKGPRIVRRSRRGVVTAYYVWRSQGV